MTLNTDQHEIVSPLDQLVADHDVIQRALVLLEDVAECLEHEQVAPENTRKWLVKFFSEFVDKYHHHKEEHGLFPLLELAGIPREGGPVGIMLREHEQGREFIRAMAQTSEEGQQSARHIKEYISFLQAHIEKENRVLFPLANEILDDHQKQELGAIFETVKQQTLGDQRYRELLTELETMEVASKNEPRARLTGRE